MKPFVGSINQLRNCFGLYVASDILPHIWLFDALLTLFSFQGTFLFSANRITVTAFIYYHIMFDMSIYDFW